MPLSVNELFTNLQFAFPKLLAYRILMVLGYQMVAVAVGWHIYEITHDPFALGLVGLAEVIPYFSSALFAGYAVDHYFSRRGFAALAGIMLALNALFLTTIANGHFLGNQAYWIYGSIAITGFARAFIAPSYNTIFAQIVPRTSYAKASGIGSTMFQIGLILGPAIGGLLVGFASQSKVYTLASALFFSAVLSISLLKIKEPAKAEHAPVFKSIAEGLRFVWGNQIVFGAQMLDMFAVLFGGAVAMLPAFVQDIYQMGPEGLGVLRAAPAVGAILMGLWLTKHPINLHAGRYLLLSVAGFGVSMILFAITPYYLAAIIILLASGAFDAVSVVLRQTILQLATPDAMRGRVSAINGIFIGSSNELGAFESGLTAKLFGLIPSVIFGGVLTLSVVGLTAKFAPKLRNLELNQLH